MASQEQHPLNRVALVTGAARGIGEAIALQLAQDGFDIAINDISDQEAQLAKVVQAIQSKGRRAIFVCGDISSESDVVSIVSKTVAELGGLDVMVANAGIARSGSITEHSVEDWDRVLEVNGRGTFLCVKHAARHMIAQGRGGRILCASSDAGKNGCPNYSAYSASKFAIRGLVHSAAMELRTHKITVNAYCPGLILTPLVMHPDDEACGGPGRKVMQALGMPADIEPVGPSHVADLVSYLAKPETSYVTGQSYSINGGWFLG